MFGLQFKKMVPPGVAAFALALGAASIPVGSQAATCNSPSGPSVTYTLSQGNPDAVAQHACFSGNDSNTILPAYELFGLTGWTLGEKIDYPAGGGTTTSGDGAITFGAAPIPGATAPASWSVSNPDNYTNVVVTLKQANSFAAFLLDETAILSGTWSIAGPGNSANGLSHTSVYYQGPATTIPLPAGGLLLITALGGLGIAARRRRKAA